MSASVINAVLVGGGKRVGVVVRKLMPAVYSAVVSRHVCATNDRNCCVVLSKPGSRSAGKELLERVRPSAISYLKILVAPPSWIPASLASTTAGDTDPALASVSKRSISAS